MHDTSWISICFSVVLVCADVDRQRDQKTDLYRIVGGKDAVVRAAPYQVSLRVPPNTHFCGGSIISPRTIVTACHCLYGPQNASIFVVVGTNYLNYGGNSYQVSRIILHPSYNPLYLRAYYFDVGLVILQYRLTYTPAVWPIAISSAYYGDDIPLTITGWGKRTNTSPASNILQTLDVMTITNQECQSSVGPNIPISSAIMCTVTVVNSGFCNGDSGGPLVDLSRNRLVGVISFMVGVPGHACANKFPDGYTRLSFYADWINTNKV